MMWQRHASLAIMTGVGSLSQLASTALSCQASARAARQADKIGSDQRPADIRQAGRGTRPAGNAAELYHGMTPNCGTSDAKSHSA